MDYINAQTNEEEIFVETRGRKPLYLNESLDVKIEKLIAWVEGRYTPLTEGEEEELYAYGERVYPYLMELQYTNQ